MSTKKTEIKYSDKLFGTLFKPNDTLVLTNLITNESVIRRVDRFDGLEYVFDNGDKLGHSGFSMDGHIYLNREPILKVEVQS